MNKFEEYYKDKAEFKNIELILSRIDNALKDIDFKEERLGKIVHIAGTNGKGSTSYFLAQICIKNGKNVCLFTSPHILEINERINYNDKNISNDDMDRIFSQYSYIIEKYNLSYFEAVFFISIIYFMEKNPDITILETGLGGRYDATNTNIIKNKLCVLTSMGQDHTNFLGKNIYNILEEKTAILRESSTFVVALNKNFVYDTINKLNLKNKIIFVKEDDIISNEYYPQPYNENYSTAKKVYETLENVSLNDYYNLKLPPCRMEIKGRIILDGTHNMPGIIKIYKTWQNKKIDAVIFTVTNDRNPDKLLLFLNKISKNVILTTLPDNIRSIDEKDIHNNCIFIENPVEALEYALKEYSGNILVTGSFYLCGYIKKYIETQGLDIRGSNV